MLIQDCEFSNPIQTYKIGGAIFYDAPDGTNANFQYQKMHCTTTDTASSSLLMITNGTSTFWLDRTFSYADFLLIFLLVSLVAMSFFDFIQRFIYKIKVNFRH